MSSARAVHSLTLHFGVEQHMSSPHEPQLSSPFSQYLEKWSQPDVQTFDSPSSEQETSSRLRRPVGAGVAVGGDDGAGVGCRVGADDAVGRDDGAGVGSGDGRAVAVGAHVEPFVAARRRRRASRAGTRCAKPTARCTEAAPSALAAAWTTPLGT